MDKKRIELLCSAINTMAGFFGKRDLDRLTPASLLKSYGIRQADVFVMFGASIPASYRLYAEAFRQKIAKHYVVTGGIGHTTAMLQRLMQAHPYFSDTDTSQMPEAEIMKAYLGHFFDTSGLLVENRSTNCGNNVTYTLDLLRDRQINWDSIIISQDATMQLRMHAGFLKYCPDKTIINFAGYRNPVLDIGGTLGVKCPLGYKETLWGMWDIERYVNLLLGEYARISDTKDGYGPNGKGYIAHIAIPEEVTEAYHILLEEYGAQAIRTANEAYRSESAAHV